jgi:hypothetical protein
MRSETRTRRLLEALRAVHLEREQERRRRHWRADPPERHHAAELSTTARAEATR